MACTNFEVAKVFVNVDVTKALPKHITFTKNGKSFRVNYYYPWLPARCKYCEKWGHSEAVCAAKSKGKKRKEVTDSPSSKDSPMRAASSVDVRKLEGTIIEKSGELSPGVRGLEIQKQSISDLTKEKGIMRSDSATVEGQKSVWYMVSPGKMGRVVKASDQTEVVQISASKYSVLSVDVEEEGEIAAEVQQVIETAENHENEESAVSEGELEDENLDQQVREEVKVGKRRGRKAKVPDENPGKSTRPPRRKY